MSTPSTEDQWAQLRGGLPSHQEELETAHEGTPSIEVQDRTHGAGLPAEDRGPDPGSVI